MVPLLTQHTLDEIPPRIQRLRISLNYFHIKKPTHVPDKEHYTPDALSRMQSDNRSGQAMIPDEELNIYIASVTDTLPISDAKL